VFDFLFPEDQAGTKITAQQCRSATEKFILEDLLSLLLSYLKKYHPSGNLKFNYLVILQSLKLRILMEKKSYPHYHGRYLEPQLMTRIGCSLAF